MTWKQTKENSNEYYYYKRKKKDPEFLVFHKGSVQINNCTLLLPKELEGRRVRLKLEVVDDV